MPRLPDQAKLLCQRGEQKIGVLFGQEIQRALRSLHIAGSPRAARTERGQGLCQVIAGSERILGRIEKGENSVVLVVLQQLPRGSVGKIGRHRGGHSCRDSDADRKQGQAGQEQDSKSGKCEQNGGAEIGLDQDEQGGHTDENKSGQMGQQARAGFRGTSA